MAQQDAARLALGLTLTYMLAELVTGIATGSLALLDADRDSLRRDSGDAAEDLREAVHILLEGTPAQLDLELLVRKVREIEDPRDGRRILRAVCESMKFGIDHVTVQIEDAAQCAGIPAARLKRAGRLFLFD